MLTKLYTYQIICYRHEKDRENDYISSLIRYIQYKEKIIKDYEGRIFTIITTIFLPLSFMVGFFGMNFKGMGVPSLKKGIYNIKNPEYYVISISIITIIIGLSIFIH